MTGASSPGPAQAGLFLFIGIIRAGLRAENFLIALSQHSNNLDISLHAWGIPGVSAALDFLHDAALP